MALEMLHGLLEHQHLEQWLYDLVPAFDGHGGPDDSVAHLTAASNEDIVQVASDIGTENDYQLKDPEMGADDVHLERYLTYLRDHAQVMLDKCLALQRVIGGPNVDAELDAIIKGLRDEVAALSGNQHDYKFLKHHAGEIRELKDWAAERARDLARGYRKG